jgi:hypothetical protein
MLKSAHEHAGNLQAIEQAMPDDADIGKAYDEAMEDINAADVHYGCNAATGIKDQPEGVSGTLRKRFRGRNIRQGTHSSPCNHD